MVENPKVKIVDVFPSFVKRGEPPTCNSSLYVKVPHCSKRDENVLWNDLGIQKAVLRILEGKVNRFFFLLSVRFDATIVLRRMCGVEGLRVGESLLIKTRMQL